ncbi:MAG: ASCH domain-containing protein [Elusimicrobia bacterium]|nr:ASCH domain-containing protein [Elusimicrobiota bacterium]MDE2510414.1 ASCH domain-containing protein [Elusimicrobiota bacterium]
MKRFRFGWYGDGGLGERMIQTILAGRKSATSCPAYDPEDADLKAGDELQLVDKHGTLRGQLLVTLVELRPFGGFDEALAAKEGVTLPELKEKMNFANGRQLRDDEEMRVVHFRLLRAVPGQARP